MEQKMCLGQVPFDTTERYEVWGLRFAAKDGALSREYFYKIDFDRMLTLSKNNYDAISIRNTFLSTRELSNMISPNTLTAFNIINERGYNYREASVVLGRILSREQYNNLEEKPIMSVLELREIDKIYNVHQIKKNYSEKNRAIITEMYKKALRSGIILRDMAFQRKTSLVPLIPSLDGVSIDSNSIKITEGGKTFVIGENGITQSETYDNIGNKFSCLQDTTEKIGESFKTLSDRLASNLYANDSSGEISVNNQKIENCLSNKLSFNLTDNELFNLGSITNNQIYCGEERFWENSNRYGINRNNPFNNEYEIKFENSEKINYNNNTIKNKGENTMFENVFKGFRFGKVNDVKMSIYGPAFRCGDGTMYAYDNKEMEYVDVTDLCIGNESFCYAMPVAAADVKIGDYICHNNCWARVNSFDAAGYLVLEKIYSREIVTVMPTRSAFGFDFYTKLLCPFESLSGTATKDAPFGNMLPFILMSENSGNKDMLLPLMLMNGGNMDLNNPLMLMVFMGDREKNSMLPMLMMMQNGSFGKGGAHKAHQCDCCCSHQDEE